ncbi:endonuclease/exonuclease/phosphatase family protein [Pseudoalteromonas piratica]|uniref:Endonuclease/exonuclease/phosphatase domain-containing protein n=1 Tax=Pseudoalteromonas piratica TaxID=1348114 RepID=A0A0A7EFN8_9GAMM|nr:endonuclease/exonuclease/phosphatase family protein [Pseudoalteromonas piratica]AIY65429.1 hypothetical protein OM33_09920 [Pseudoalteromonas piratica]
MRNKLIYLCLAISNILLLINYAFKDAFFLSRLVSYFLDYFLLVTLFLSIAAIVFIGKRAMLFGLLPGALFYSVVINIKQEEGKLHSLKGLPAFSVMTHSVMGRNNNYQPIQTIIIEKQPDILFLQEVTNINLLLTNNIQALYPFHESRLESGLLILSKYPLQREANFSNLLSVIADISGYKIRLSNVHSIKSISNYDRYQQYVRGLSEHFAVNSGPAIIAGDFNMTQYNEYYREMSNSYIDLCRFCKPTFPAPGRRIGSIYPVLRIDYIFTNIAGCKYNAETIIYDTTSDHYPVFANFCEG